jgi:hypothetical protein
MNCSQTFIRCVSVGIVWLAVTIASGSDDFDAPPIRYRDSTPTNRISRLQSQLDSGVVQLKYHAAHGYLPAVLQALKVPIESQMLVFSKTSLQVRYINVQTPRAIYFNDDIYVGYCQSGDVMEVSAVDPVLGTVFYTLDQQPLDKPRFERRIDNCVVCHQNSATGGVPGHMVRSLFVDADGQPMLSAGGRSIDHTTPLEHRWGGWYVSGKHGSHGHLGNLVIRTREVPRPIDNSAGLNVEDLASRLRVDHYLAPHSDIVALMVLEHQTFVHNRLTRANFITRQALVEAAKLKQMPVDSANQELAVLTRRIHEVGDELVDAMLMVDEAKITAPITGTSGYARYFEALGPRDKRGRSLRQFDLTRRLFRYPCSYVIYSESFDALPDEVRDYVWQRLWNVVTETDKHDKFAHLSRADRQAIAEIIAETKPNRPAYWKPGTAASER